MSKYGAAVTGQLTAIAHARNQSAIALKTPATNEETSGIEFKPGDRVLDTISGKEGTVNAGTIKHTVLPTA